MTALIVIAAIVLIFAVLFMFSIRAELTYTGGKFEYCVKYMFFTVYPRKKKPKKKDKPAKKEKSSEFVPYGEDIPEEISGGVKDNALPESAPADEPPAPLSDEDKELLTGKPDGEKPAKDEKGRKKKEKDKKEKVSLGTRIEQGKILWGCVKKPLKRLFRGIYISELVIDFTAGGEDAYAAGMNFGTLNAVVFNAISAVRFIFPVSVKTVDINVDFDLPKSVYDASCSVRLRLGTALAVLLTAGIAVLIKWNALNSVGKEEAEPEKNPAEQSA